MKRKPKHEGFSNLKTEVSDHCSISRPTLDSYLQQPTFPAAHPDKGWNLRECLDWVVANTEKSAIAASLNSELADLKKWDIYERARKQKISNDAKDKILMPVADHENVIREALREMGKELFLIPDRAPELTGQSASEISMRLRAMITEALKHIRSLSNDKALG